MFQWRKKRRAKRDDDDDEVDASGDTDASDDETEGSEVVPGQDPENYEWVKKVDADLRTWIETRACRRDITDKHFDNPSVRKGEVHFIV
jgi:hypothetical protein